MKYIGSFADIYGRVVTVEIENDEPGADIRLDSGGIRFDTEGVTTETSYNDEYDTLMRESCTVKLVVDSPIFALYSRGVLDNRIRVTRDGEPIFTGYVEPQAYTQPFVKVRDTLEVCCIDVFSALQYCLWGDVSAPGVIWAEERVKAGPRTVGDILRTVFGKTAPDMEVNITSDLLTADRSTSIADGVMIDTSVFFGDDEESTWTLEEVADAVLAYFNLRACVAGDHIEVYHPDTLGTAAEKSIDRSTTWEATHTIDITETYNRLKLTCERMETEEVIPQPLEDGALMPMFPYPELITTEYWAYGPFDFLRIAGFGGSTWNEQVIYKGGEINHWFRVMKANGWKMRNRYGMYTGGESQRELVNGVQDSHGALFMEVTTGKDEYDSQNNAIPDKADEGRYLVIGVGGFGNNGETYLNNMGQCIKSAMPCATYEGVTAMLSPSDDETTRYIVFDGSIRLNPRHNPGLSYDSLATKVHVVPDKNGNPLLSWDDISQCMEDYDTSKEDAEAAVDGEEGKRYYTRRYWHTDTPGGEPENIDGITVPDYGINPMEDDDFFSRYEYKYSAHGDGNDRMRKLPLLSCMLIVGDKCVVESKHTGEIDDYRWVKYKTLEECKDEDEYYAQSFILGVDPKIGDKIIGPSRDITNNIHYSLHLGVTIQPDYYEKEYTKAQRNGAEAMLAFRTKLLNVYAENEKQSWIPAAKAREVARKATVEGIVGKPEAMAAIDLSVRGDFSAVTVGFYDRQHNSFGYITDYFFPEGALTGHVNERLYRKWASEGYLRLLPGEVIDYNLIVEHVLKIADRTSLMRIGYDSYKARDVVNMLATIGGADSVVGVSQTKGNFNAAVESFEHGIWTGKIWINDNPINYYCFGNAILVEDNMENKKPEKRVETQRIDGVITMLMCHRLFLDEVQ